MREASSKQARAPRSTSFGGAPVTIEPASPTNDQKLPDGFSVSQKKLMSACSVAAMPVTSQPIVTSGNAPCLRKIVDGVRSLSIVAPSSTTTLWALASQSLACASVQARRARPKAATSVGLRIFASSHGLLLQTQLDHPVDPVGPMLHHSRTLLDQRHRPGSIIDRAGAVRVDV